MTTVKRVVRFCDHSNQKLGHIKGLETLEQLSNCHLYEKDSDRLLDKI
jgi:hypothetical protein